MNLRLQLRTGDDVRALWALAIAVLIGGSLYLHHTYERRIAASYARSQDLYADTVADTRMVRSADRLKALQKRVEEDIRRISRDRSMSSTTVKLLSSLERSAKTFHTRILEIEPGAAQAAPNKALEATGLTIRVSGAFRDLLHFVEDLSHHATLVSVGDTELSLGGRGETEAADPRLEAVIHATLYRLRLPGEKEDTRASTP